MLRSKTNLVMVSILLAVFSGQARGQVTLSWEPQQAWTFRSLAGERSATEYHLAACNLAAQPRTLLGLEAYTAAARHVRYLTQSTMAGYAAAARQTRMSLWRAGGYALAGIGFLGTAAQAGREIKIDRPGWLVGAIPEITAIVGSAALWWGKNPPPAEPLPANLLGPFVNLAPSGRVGACADLVMFAAPQSAEPAFTETIP